MKHPVFLAFVFFAYTCHAQNFGGNPGRIKWQQINTPNARVIFPKGNDSLAQRIATLTGHIAAKHRATVGGKLHKTSIVLQQYNTLSNGYVQLAPWRSEFYLTPPQNPFELGSMNWAGNLAIHEFRHIQQYSNNNVGLSRVARIVLGEQGQALFNAIAVPDWFFEGDAVWNETALSQQGRGRLPNFFNAYKSLAPAGKNYSWMKLRNGSLKSFVPNHYDLGYLLVAYGREKYGDSVWTAITRDAAAFKGVFYPLQKAVLRHTGINYQTFRENAFAFYRQQWQAEAGAPPQWLTPVRKNNVVDYKYPYPAGDSAFIVLRSSLNEIPRFEKHSADGRTVQKIAVKAIGFDDYYSYRNNLIVYSAYQPDTRWANRDYSVITVLDVLNGQSRTITSKTKYYAPDINAAGNQVVAIDVQPGNPSQIHILNMDGEVQQRFSAGSGLFYSHPKFLPGGNILVAARQESGAMGWLLWNVAENSHRWLTQPVNRVIGFPQVQGDTVLFTASAGKNDALFMLDVQTGTETLVAGYLTGVYQGFISQGSITASVFTADGYRLASFAPAKKTVSQQLQDLYTPASLAGEENITALPTANFPVSKYRKTFRLFNFHSWQPEVSDPEYSFLVLGDNVLNTLSSQVRYTYNRNERSSRLGYTGVYGGWFVQPFLNVQQTWGRGAVLNADTTLFYNQTEAGFGLQLPLNMSGGKMYRNLNLSTSINTETVRWNGYAKGRYRDLDFNYWNIRLSYSMQIQRAIQHIYPRFALTLLGDYRSIINNYTASQYLLSGSLYLPGLLRSHNLVLTAAYQGRDTMNQYLFSSAFPFSRGYSAVNFPRQFRVGVNYHFPLFYPDWGFGNMLYFRRVRANVFYDFTQGKSLRTGATYPFSTVGSEVYFDLKVWNQLPVSFGVRYSRLLDREFRGATYPNVWELILPVNLIQR